MIGRVRLPLLPFTWAGLKGSAQARCQASVTSTMRTSPDKLSPFILVMTLVR